MDSETGGRLVVPLEAFGRGDLATAGGKGANLGELARAGFAVPAGFVVTTQAYDLVARENEVTARGAALAEMDPGDERAMGEAGRALQEAFERAPIPAEVAEAVRGALAELGDAPVAVRSSATAEDLPGAAFAGQQETFLNVVGDAAVLDAVRRCWASLWTERAIAYRQARGIDHREVKLAAVVQRLVPAEVAGVAFTANPVTGARDELVIDASPGLGEAVVSGAVTPDHYVVRKGSHVVVERRLGRREVVIRPTAGGGTESSRPEPGGTEPALSTEQVQELATMAEAVERHFGGPQDIEWAFAEGRLWVLQARPITALPPEAVGAPALAAKPKRRRGFRPPNFAGELVPARPYPLDATSHMRVLLAALQESMTGPLGARFPTVEQLVQEETGLPVRIRWGASLGPSWRMLYKPWLSLWERRHVDLSRWREDPVIGEATRRAHALERRDLRALPWEEVLGMFREALELIPFILTLRKRYLLVALKDAGLLWLLLRAAGQQRHFGALLSGMENKTFEINRALEELAAAVRETPALRRLFAETPAADLTATLERLAADAPEARAFTNRFARFLDEYGHRESAILLLSMPTWKDDPAAPLGIVKTLAASPSVPVYPAARSAETPAWERARDEVLAHSVLGKGPLRQIFLHRLERGRLLSQVREDTHFYVGLAHPAERRCAMELGRRLAEVGVLDAAEEVFLLRMEELEELGRPWPPTAETVRRLRTVVEDRRARRAALAHVPVVEVDPADAPEAVEGALLTGQPGSVGVAQGPVRVIRGPAEFGKLQAGDVLVAPFTNPSWTPLFPRACAVVVDTGAAMSHAAIVAREYGVPAVMGAAGATSTLRDGQRVRVDGGRGAVYAA